MHDLPRFHKAQSGGIYEIALQELEQGQKCSHWMWFIFPQLRSLGRSNTAKLYGIANRAEAIAYLKDPILGTRLRTCCWAMLKNKGTPPDAVLGSIDAMKLRSCATLFDAAFPNDVFAEILKVFYGVERCHDTLAEVGKSSA